jgi:hypothetical protein
MLLDMSGSVGLVVNNALRLVRLYLVFIWFHSREFVGGKWLSPAGLVHGTTCASQAFFWEGLVMTVWGTLDT